MRAAFMEGTDIHQATAANIFGVLPGEVTSELRGRAKAINFGVIYGMGAQRLARDTGLGIHEAQEFIESYFEKYPKVKAYLDAQVLLARTEGFVETILKRRRPMTELTSQSRQIQNAAERIAVNTPIQGSAADMIKVAMIRIDEKLNDVPFRARMLLQVHDELLFEVEEAHVSELAELVRFEMCNAVKLDVPLKVDVGWGTSWFDAHG
jgi:DNA polymerase-1